MIQEILNKFIMNDLELVLYKYNSRYQIDINNTDQSETIYHYSFNNKKEAEEFFESMWKHIFAN